MSIPASNTLAYYNCTHDNETDQCLTVSMPFTGFSSETFRNNSLPSWTADYTNGVDNQEPCTFAIVFAVIFSGVTGEKRRNKRLPSLTLFFAIRHYGGREHVGRVESAASEHSTRHQSSDYRYIRCLSAYHDSLGLDVLTVGCLWHAESLTFNVSSYSELLTNNYSVAQAIAATPIPIVLMIFFLTSFAAMSNIIGASRVLLRLAEDRIFGTFESAVN